MMTRKRVGLFVLLFLTVVLSGCTTQSVTCGEGTIIREGKCVAPDTLEDPKDDPVDDVSCDDITGDIVYQSNFTSTTFVDNEIGNAHTANNFVIWGQSTDSTLLSLSTVTQSALHISGLIGTQLNPFHESGLGYQFFQFDTDKTYTVCTIVEGTEGQSIYSELGIFYGHGTRDQVELTGNQQIIIQDFRPSLTTNTDYGQYVLFFGTMTGELIVHNITVTVSE